MSDYADRRPLFDTLMKTVRHAEELGAFEGVSSSVLTLLGGMFPVGIEDDGSIVPPPNYDPLKEVPVLLGSRPSKITVTGLVKSAEEIKFRGIHVVKPEQTATVTTNRCAGMVGHILLSTRSEVPRRHITLPAFVWMNTDNYEQTPQIAAHELDHWDFLMRLGMFEDLATTVATSERRAHRTGLRVLRNLGQITTDNIRDFEEMIKGDRPHKLAIRKAQFMKYIYGIAGAHSVVAHALSKHFGPEGADDQATPHEVTAYRMAGYI